MEKVKLFPLRGRVKSPPLTEDWERNASPGACLPDLHPTNNYGIACGPSGLVVVDIDTKSADGKQSLIALQMQYDDLPETLTIRTPSGGLHLYFSGSTRSRIALRPGIDIRSRGGYVVAAGSITPLGPYTVMKRCDIAPCPDWLLDLIGKQPDKITMPEIESRSEIDVQRAITYLEYAAPAIEGQGGDGRTYQVACAVRDLGIPEPLCTDLMAEYYNHRCIPPWSIPELQQKVENAYRYAAQPQGNKAAEETPFSVIPEPAPKIRAAGDIVEKDIPKRQWILGRRLIRKYISVLIAPGGVGKSTLTMADAISLATGRNFSGDRPHGQYRTWVINAEDPLQEMELRLSAACRLYDIPLSEIGDRILLSSGRDLRITLASMTRSGPIVNQIAVDDMVKHITTMQVDCLMLDPFVRLHDCDENDNRAIDMVMQALTAIADRTGCSVVVVHHTRKLNGASGAGDPDTGRGAGSMIAACRIAHTLSTMSETEAKDFGVTMDRRRWYIRLDDAKQNMAAPADCVRWYERQSMTLANGDDAGALKHVELERVIGGDEEKNLFVLCMGMYEPGEHKISEVLETITADLQPQEIKGITARFKKYVGSGIKINTKMFNIGKDGRYSTLVVSQA